jgi:8-oxo-dGTP diphosphatase
VSPPSARRVSVARAKEILDDDSARREPRLVVPGETAPPDSVYEVPRIPASAGALIFDRGGRLLVLKPTYKSGWTVPGGQMEADGETPWEACRREVHEECGLVVDDGRLVCVDFLRPRPGKPGGMRFLFDCGALDDGALAGIVIQEDEISDYRFEDLPAALGLLSGPLRRRVGAAVGAPGTVYLEDGRPVDPPGDGPHQGV